MINQCVGMNMFADGDSYVYWRTTYTTRNGLRPIIHSLKMSLV